MPDLHAGFQAQSAATLQGRMGFLDRVDSLGYVQAIKRHLREVLALRPGQRVVDVGCGTGHELARLAADVGSGGTALGIEKSPEMATGARERAAALTATASALVADARRILLPDGWADAVRAERVLMYIREAETAIAELVRVTRRGGRVAVFELDYGATLIDLPDRAAAGRVHGVLAATIPHRWMGRSLPRLLHDHGLRDISVEPFAIRLPHDVHDSLVRPALETAVAAGELDPATCAAWVDGSRLASESGYQADTFVGIAAAGRKPA